MEGFSGTTGTMMETYYFRGNTSVGAVYDRPRCHNCKFRTPDPARENGWNSEISLILNVGAIFPSFPRALTYLSNPATQTGEILKLDESCISNPKSEISNWTAWD